LHGPAFLGDEIEFPPAEDTTADGLLAVGGDLQPERLLLAYRRGIFPWPWDADAEMLWWCPDPRFVLYPHELRVSKSLEQRMGSERFEVRFDTAFEDVIRGCATAARPDDPGTWITDELAEAYVKLHAMGFAHCAESWRDGELVGGLYGVALGAAFFGESMFHTEPDASKVAFATLVRALGRANCGFVDCQLPTGHLARLGARPIRRRQFLHELDELLVRDMAPLPWKSS